MLQVVEVELPQRAVQVVRAADRPARLHARELLHRRSPRGGAARRGPCSCSAASSIAASSSRDIGVPPPPPWACRPGRSPSRRSSSASPSPSSSPVEAGAEQREVDVEDGVERAAGGAGASPAWRSSTALNTSRSSMWMCSIARMASRFSVIDTGSPAVRSSWTNPWRTSSSVSDAPEPARHAVLDRDRARRRAPAAPCGPWRCRTGT